MTEQSPCGPLQRIVGRLRDIYAAGEILEDDDLLAIAEAAGEIERLQAQNDRMLAALNAALGVGGDFPLRKEGDPPYWWRTWLQEFAGLEYSGERFQPPNAALSGADSTAGKTEAPGSAST